MATIRDAATDDIDDIVKVHSRALRRAYKEILPADYLDSDDLGETYRDKWNRLLQSDAQFLAAEERGAVVGFCCFSIGGDNAAGELEAVFVDPNHWSTGTGSALLRAARDAWKANGTVEAQLWTADVARALRSFKKNNWERTEEQETQDFDGHKVTVEKLMLQI